MGVAVSIGEKVSLVSKSGLMRSDRGDSNIVEYRSYRKSESVASEACRIGLGEGGPTTRFPLIRMIRSSSSSGIWIFSGMIDEVSTLWRLRNRDLFSKDSSGVRTLRSDGVSTDDSRSKCCSTSSPESSSRSSTSSATRSYIMSILFCCWRLSTSKACCCWRS